MSKRLNRRKWPQLDIVQATENRLSEFLMQMKVDIQSVIASLKQNMPDVKKTVKFVKR